MYYYHCLGPPHMFSFLCFQALSDELLEREGELAAEKKNSLKRDKTIQGLSLVLKEKEKEV